MLLREASFRDMEELMAFYTVTNEVINVRNDQYDPENEIFPSEEMVSSAVGRREQIVGIEDGRIVLALIANGECDDSYHTVRWNTEAGPGEFWVIHALRVLPEYEGRGFAKQALAHLIGRAPQCGIKAIRLDVLEGYGVAELYRHFGFRYVDTVEIFYADIGHPEKFRLLERVI